MKSKISEFTNVSDVTGIDPSSIIKKIRDDFMLTLHRAAVKSGDEQTQRKIINAFEKLYPLGQFSDEGYLIPPMLLVGSCEPGEKVKIFKAALKDVANILEMRYLDGKDFDKAIEDNDITTKDLCFLSPTFDHLSNKWSDDVERVEALTSSGDGVFFIDNLSNLEVASPGIKKTFFLIAEEKRYSDFDFSKVYFGTTDDTISLKSRNTPPLPQLHQNISAIHFYLKDDDKSIKSETNNHEQNIDLIFSNAKSSRDASKNQQISNDDKSSDVNNKKGFI